MTDGGPVLLKYARRTLPIRYQLRPVAVTMFGAPGICGSLAIREEGEVVRLGGTLVWASRFAVIVRENGKVVSRGWGTETELTPVQLAGNVLQMGVQTLICTDVSRDGMMGGPNTSLLSEILDAGAKRVIASGGISSMEDLRKIQLLESRGVIGAIVGKAIYEGAIDVKAALALLSE